MRKFVTQMLDEIQADPKSIELYKNDAALKLIALCARGKKSITQILTCYLGPRHPQLKAVISAATNR